MYFQTTKAALNSAVQRTQGVLADRSMAKIGIKAEKDAFTFYCSDTMMSVFSSLPAKILRDGLVFLPSKIFADLVRELPEGDVHIERLDQEVVVRAGTGDSFKMNISVIEDSSWPEAQDFSGSSNIAQLPANRLKYAIDQVLSCIQIQSSRNYGMVGYIHRNDENTCRIVGSDGFRLSYCDFNAELPLKFLTQGISMSRRCLIELRKMCDEGFSEIELAIAEDQHSYRASIPGTIVYGRLSTVRFPKYQGVIPKEDNTKVELLREVVRGMTKRVMLAADKGHAVKLNFYPTGMTMSSKTAGTTESSESVAVDDYQGKETALFINGKYFSDVLSSTSSEKVSLKFKDRDDPFLIRPELEPEGCRTLHVLVPIRENI